MKQTITFLLLFLPWSISSAQQDIAINTKMNIPLREEIFVADATPAITYMVMSADKKVKGEFKDLVITISPNHINGMMSLVINSKRNQSVLIELKNSIEDVLFFQSLDLKEGENIIPFETDDVSVVFFQLKLSEVDSNRSSSFLILKK